MIARPKISRNEWKTTEIGAFEVGNFAPFSCPGKTAAHYSQMVELHDELGNEGLEILAFPCNQFGNQEPATCEVVAEFAKSAYGADFTMMEKVAVHGPRAHPVYNFLRATTGATPSWNFGVYFVVSRSGEVKAYPDVAPAQLAGVLRGEL